MKRKNIVLTFDDACTNHLTMVVPLLKKLGFGATFFISRPAHWLEKFPGAFLNPGEIAEISRAGFEIGNHTLNHPDLRSKSDDECRSELQKLNEFFAENGIPRPVSFAYPGGPYAANAVPLLAEANLHYARTTEHALWDKSTDPMRIPCYAICDQESGAFDEALAELDKNPDAAAVLLYHGVPDEPHPWCSTAWELFEKQMHHLAAAGYRVSSMANYGDLQ